MGRGGIQGVDGGGMGSGWVGWMGLDGGRIGLRIGVDTWSQGGRSSKCLSTYWGGLAKNKARTKQNLRRHCDRKEELYVR